MLSLLSGFPVTPSQLSKQFIRALIEATLKSFATPLADNSCCATWTTDLVLPSQEDICLLAVQMMNQRCSVQLAGSYPVIFTLNTSCGDYSTVVCLGPY